MPQSYEIPLAERARVSNAATAGSKNARVLAGNAQKASGKALDEKQTHYTDRPGIPQLRKLVADRLSAQGLPVAADEVVITCGIEEARFVIMKILGSSNGLAGADADLKELASLCNVPTYPDKGLIWSKPGAGELPANGTAVVELGNATIVLPEGVAGRCETVVIGELADADLLRIGFMAVSGLDAKSLRDFKQALTICSPNLSQWIALALAEAE